MARIEVVAGDFLPNGRSRFDGASMLLHPRAAAGCLRHRPTDIIRFSISDGVWARWFLESGDWTRAIKVAAVAGAPLALANLPIFSTAFPGQRALLTWANALIGAAAATAALKSERMVRFDVGFDSGRALQARAPERALMVRLPHIYRAMARRV
jgi:hypothetical protein